MATAKEIVWNGIVIGGLGLLAYTVFSHVSKRYLVSGKVNGNPIYFETYSLKDAVYKLYDRTYNLPVRPGDKIVIVEDSSLILEFVHKNGKLVVDRSNISGINESFNLGNVQGYIND